MEDLPQGFFLGVTVFLGLVFGSFATALAWRVPRGISIFRRARSACPSCNRKLTAPDLVPVFSWLFLRGRCRTCNAKIGFEYPAIELATLVLCLLFYARFGVRVETLFLFALAPVLVSIIAIDFRFMIIPDGLNLAILGIGAAGLLAGAVLSPGGPDVLIAHGGESLAGAVLYIVVSLALRYGVMAVLKKDPLGMGDIKFFGAAGFWLGLNPDSGAYLMMASGLSGIILALFWRHFRKEAEFPFGPALLAGFTAMLLWQGAVFVTP